MDLTTGTSNQKELLDQFCSIEEGSPQLKKREEELDEKEKELNKKAKLSADKLQELNKKAKISADKLQELKNEHDQTKEKLEKQEEEHDQTKEKLEKQEEVNRKLVVKKDEITEDLLEATKKLTETNKDLQETQQKLEKAEEKIYELKMQAEQPKDQGQQPQYQPNPIDILLSQIEIQKVVFKQALTEKQKLDPRIKNLFDYQTYLIEQLQQIKSNPIQQEELKEKIKNIRHIIFHHVNKFLYQADDEMLTSDYVKGGQGPNGEQLIEQQISDRDQLVKKLNQAFVYLTRNW